MRKIRDGLLIVAITLALFGLPRGRLANLLVAGFERDLSPRALDPDSGRSNRLGKPSLRPRDREDSRVHD